MRMKLLSRIVEALILQRKWRREDAKGRRISTLLRRRVAAGLPVGRPRKEVKNAKAD